MKNPKIRKSISSGPKTRESNRKAMEPSSSVMVALDNPRGLRWIMEFAPIYASVLHGIEKGLRGINKQMQVCSVRSKEEFHKLVNSAPPSGFLFLSSKNIIEFKDIIGVTPCVSILGSPCDGEFDRITYDNYATGRLAAEFFLSRGISSVAILGPKELGRFSTFGQRYRSFVETFEDRQGSAISLLSSELYEPGNPFNEPRPEEVHRLLASLKCSSPMPEGLFVMAENILPSVLAKLIDVGIVPGQDLIILSCNSDILCRTGCFAENTSVTIPSEEIGLRAVDILEWRSKNPARRPSTTLYTPVLQLAREASPLPRPTSSQLGRDPQPNPFELD